MGDSKTIPEQSRLRPWLQAQLAELTEREPAEVSYDLEFQELGLDSVSYLVLGLSIEESFDIPIAAKDIFLHSTVERLSHFLVHEGLNLRSKLTRLPKGSADYTTVNGEGDLAPLFWLNGYELLEVSARYLPKERPVYYLHHQGSDGNLARHHSIEEMAAYYIETILHIEPDGPYCIGGYSIGGTLAYEIAQQLTALGKKVDVLLLLSPAGHPRRQQEIFLAHHRRLCAKETVIRRTLYMGRKHLGRYWRIGFDMRRRLRHRIRVSPYFILRKSLPSKLIWQHLYPIYARARSRYEISVYSGDTIIAHESTNPVEEWCEMVDGLCAVIPGVPVRHLDLLSAEYADLWIEEFFSPLGVGGWDHEELKAHKGSRVSNPDPGCGIPKLVAAD